MIGSLLGRAGRWLVGVPAEPAPRGYGHLRPGHRYRVALAFADHDGAEHPAGERWLFRRAEFLPYEDGLSLFAEVDGADRQVRLQLRPDAEGPVAAALERHLPPDDEPRCLLVATRDSVCLADDVDAPHEERLEVPVGADAAGVARAALAANLPAWVGARATWSLALGADRAVFGYCAGLPFVRPVAPERWSARAAGGERVHLSYHAQAGAAEVADRPGADVP